MVLQHANPKNRRSPARTPSLVVATAETGTAFASQYFRVSEAKGREGRPSAVVREGAEVAAALRGAGLLTPAFF